MKNEFKINIFTSSSISKAAGQATAVFLLFGAIAAPALAQSADEEAGAGVSRPYYFSGPCTSQGSWTQQALNQTQRLREITMQLKDDPNCKALSSSMQATLTKMDEQLKAAADTQQASTRLSQLPQEIASLRTFVTENSKYKSAVLNLMMNRAMEQSTLSAQVQSKSGASAQSTAADLLNLGTRLQKSTKNGLEMFNNVVGQLPQVEQCLATPNQMGPLLSGSIKLLASFASSGQDESGNQLAMAVAKVSDMLREQKYALALKKLNEQDFLASVSCLMEVTSESYCSARDGMMMFKKQMDDLKVTATSADAMTVESRSANSSDVNNPLLGYYILTQQVPAITNWLHKVQIGVDPKMPTDANYQIRILDDINNFFKNVKALQGAYNNRLNIIKSLTDVKAQQNYVVEMVVNITALMTDDSSMGGTQNFFTIGGDTAMGIPFKLIGIPIPQRVSGVGTTGYTQSYSDWLQANYKSLSEFQNPIALAEKIGANMNLIIDSSRVSAIEFYNRLFIVDKAGIVNDSLLGVNYNVKESLISIDRYLENLQVRVSKYSYDQSIIASLMETRSKIARILVRYKDLEVLSKKFTAQLTPPTNEQRAHFVEVNSSLIKEVYDQFEVLLARSGWLANRMVKFVYYDYTILLRSKVDLSPYYEELFYATGQAAMDRMIQMGGGNPANVQSDLMMALRINKGNLEALEQVLKGNIVQMISQLKMVSENKTTSTLGIYWDSHKRSFMDGYDYMSDENPNERPSNPVYQIAKGLWNSFSSLVIDPVVDPGNAEKYPVPNVFSGMYGQVSKLSPDDEFGSAKNLYSQMCIQALAFNDLKSFWYLCKDANIKSPFMAPEGDAQLKKDFNDYLSLQFSKKAYENVENPAINHSKRICGFRDYNRRNLVLYLTLNMKKDKASNEAYLIQAEDEIRTEIASERESDKKRKEKIGKIVFDPKIDDIGATTKQPKNIKAGDRTAQGHPAR